MIFMSYLRYLHSAQDHSFIILSFIVLSITDFELHFCKRCQMCVKVLFVSFLAERRPIVFQYFKHSLLKRLHFRHWNPLSPLTKINWSYTWSLILYSLFYFIGLYLAFHKYHIVLIIVDLW